MTPVADKALPLPESAGRPNRISTFADVLWPVDETFRQSRTELQNGRRSIPGELDSAVLKIDWERLHEGPGSVFNIERGPEQRFTIIPDGNISKQLDIDALFIRRRSSKLLVVFHGALDRNIFSLPRFEYKSSLKDFDGSILFIQDPTLYVHDRLTLGWYIGTDIDNGHLITKYLIDQAVKSLGPKQLLLTGSSGGGFAALAISARLPGSSALVFSPQTSVENYYSNHRRRLISSAFPKLDPSFENLVSLEDRLDMGALYARGASNKVHYLQNTGDPYHVKRHCLPFLHYAGLDLLDGQMRNDQIKLECRFLGEGHQAARANQMRLYVNRVFDGGF